MKTAKPILATWRAMSEEGRRTKFKLTSPSHIEAVNTFMQHADKHYRENSETFHFLAGHNLALVFSKRAVHHALAYHAQTAQALAKLVTEKDFQNRSRQTAVVTLLNLINRLEEPPGEFNSRWGRLQHPLPQ